MAAKVITVEYVAELCRRIEQGETPKRNTEVSPKEFVRQMLPHVKRFLAMGYTYKEIAEFFGRASVADLKKAVARETPETPPKKAEKVEVKKEAPARPSRKTGQGKKAQPATS